MKPFVILGSRKTATSTAVAVANTHPGAFCLYEVDFAQAPDLGRNTDLSTFLPETRVLFGTGRTTGECLSALGEMLADRGYRFDHLGTKIIDRGADLFAQLGCPALYLIRDVRTWAAKGRIVTNLIGEASAAPVIAGYVADYVATFLFPDIRRARMEDFTQDRDALPRSIAALLGLPEAGFTEWWTRTEWRTQAPKNYSNWIDGHRSAFLPPEFQDTKAVLADHPFWRALLPLFDKYYAGFAGTFSRQEVETDLAAVRALSTSHSMTLNEGYESFQSFRIHDLVRHADGRRQATSHDVVTKSAGQGWTKVPMPKHGD